MRFQELGEKVDSAVRAVKSFIDPAFEIVYSRDGAYYYDVASRDFDNYRPRYWLGTKMIEGAATEEMKEKADKSGIFGKPIVEFKLNSGATYCREALPFAFWSVKSGERKQISIDDELWKDYACFSEWKPPKKWVP